MKTTNYSVSNAVANVSNMPRSRYEECVSPVAVAESQAEVTKIEERSLDLDNQRKYAYADSDYRHGLITLDELLAELVDMSYVINLERAEACVVGVQPKHMCSSYFIYAIDYEELACRIENVCTPYGIRSAVYNKAGFVCALYESTALRRYVGDVHASSLRVCFYCNLTREDATGEQHYELVAYTVLKEAPRGTVYSRGRLIASAY